MPCLIYRTSDADLAGLMLEAISLRFPDRTFVRLETVECVDLWAFGGDIGCASWCDGFAAAMRMREVTHGA